MIDVEENMNNKIDFVIPWVNGADKTWLEKKKKYDRSTNGDTRVNRYRDWETLKYWFRGVEKFAPWVNKIYFISDEQTPDWLNLENKKLVLTDHKDYIPSKYLPTFSANPIELNLHRIKDLSEQFVYFNDDFFLLRPISPAFFFLNKKPCDDAILSPIIIEGKNTIGKICANDMGVINTHFTKEEVMHDKRKWLHYKYGIQMMRTLCLLPWHHLPGFFNDHLPQPFLKETFKTIWEKEGELLDKVCQNKFRNYEEDVNQWLMRYWQFCEGNFTPTSPKRGICYTNVCDEALNTIRKQSYSVICINDSKEDGFDEWKGKLLGAFESILPEKSSFEK